MKKIRKKLKWLQRRRFSVSCCEAFSPFFLSLLRTNHSGTTQPLTNPLPTSSGRFCPLSTTTMENSTSKTHSANISWQWTQCWTSLMKKLIMNLTTFWMWRLPRHWRGILRLMSVSYQMTLVSALPLHPIPT